MTEENENKKDEKWKKWVDVASVIFVAPIVPMIAWCGTHRVCMEPHPVHPIIIILFLDFIPFIFGYFWLGFRYENFMKFPDSTKGRISYNVKFIIVFHIIVLIAALF